MASGGNALKPCIQLRRLSGSPEAAALTEATSQCRLPNLAGGPFGRSCAVEPESCGTEMHSLAGWQVPWIYKRRLNALCTHKPSLKELETSAKLPAKQGGLSAVSDGLSGLEGGIAKWQVRLETYEDGSTMPLEADDYHVWRAVKNDIRAPSFAMASKRKACPA